MFLNARYIPIVLAASLLGITAFAQNGATAAQRGIVVQGSGVVMGQPDIVRVELGVDVVAADLASAMARADEDMAAVRDVVLAAGVAQEDIRTQTYSIWREDVRDANNVVTGARYHVNHSYQVTVRALDAIGALLPAAVEAGANSVGAIQFALSDPAALQSQARAAAMDDARRRAEELAAAGGVTLGAPLEIVEGSFTQLQPSAAFARTMASSAPVEGGQLAVSVDVTVRYAIE